VAAPYFDGALLRLDVDVRSEDSQCALAGFLSLTSQQRLADARHLFAYFQEVCDCVGEELLREDMGGLPEVPNAIWRYMTPRRIRLDAQRETPDVLVSGACGWDPEHGFLMSWRRGRELVRVAEDDGCPLNSYAWTEDDADDYVYFCTDVQYRTPRGT